MREKLREIRNKEEGFTLVELLAVIVILGIIIAIAVPSIGNIISSSQKKADEADTELIKDAGRLYFTTNDTGITAAKDATDTKPGEVSVNTLLAEGYLEIDLTDENKAHHDKQNVTINKKGIIKYINPKLAE